MLRLAVLLAVVTVLVHGKIYQPCELAKELMEEHEVPRNQVATWVCIAQHESQFNTAAQNIASQDHGLFQISEIYWCSDSDPFGNSCGISCSALRDEDITDDFICARRIYREHTRISGDGFNAWVVYPLYCKQNVEKYVDGCFNNVRDNLIFNYVNKTNDITTTTVKTTISFDSTIKQRYNFVDVPSITKSTTPALNTKNVLNSRALHYNKITTQKPVSKIPESKYNIYSREIHKVPHKFIEHPTGSRYKYHMHKLGFALYKDN